MAPASYVDWIEQASKSWELVIHPQKIVSVAEILEDSDKGEFRALLHYRLLNQVYQATEFLSLYINSAGNLLNKDIILWKNTADDRRFLSSHYWFKRSSQPVYHVTQAANILVVLFMWVSTIQVYKVEGRSDDIFYFWRMTGWRSGNGMNFIRALPFSLWSVGDYQELSIITGDEVEVYLSRRDLEQLARLNYRAVQNLSSTRKSLKHL